MDDSVFEMPEEDPVDPHASKMPADAPELRVKRHKTRRINKFRAMAVLAGSLIVLGTSLVFATAKQDKPKREQTWAGSDRAQMPELKAPDPLFVPKAAPVLTAAQPIPLPRAEDTQRWAAASADTGPYSESAMRRKRVEAFWSARAASILAETGAMPEDVGAERDTEAREKNDSEPSAVASAQDAPALSGGSAGIADDQNMQQHKDDFMQNAGSRRDDGYLRTRLQRPRSPYELKAGSIIPGTLITGINSDLPGPVVAQVRENVYDTVSGNYLLIPQGSRLIAAYDSMVAWGQQRVLLCWKRLLLPNGNSIQLECMPGADLAGAAGLTDEVDEHWWRVIKGVAIASVFAVATSASAGSTTGYNPSLPQQYARSAGTEIGNAGENITRRNMMIQPTITVRPGWSMNVMVTKDLIMEPYDDTTL